jgi:hypothetical protein
MKLFSIFSFVLVAVPLLVSGFVPVSETTETSIREYIKRSTASNIVNAIEHAATCTACEVRIVEKLFV